MYTRKGIVKEKTTLKKRKKFNLYNIFFNALGDPVLCKVEKEFKVLYQRASTLLSWVAHSMGLSFHVGWQRMCNVLRKLSEENASLCGGQAFLGVSLHGYTESHPCFARFFICVCTCLCFVCLAPSRHVRLFPFGDHFRQARQQKASARLEQMLTERVSSVGLPCLPYPSPSSVSLCESGCKGVVEINYEANKTKQNKKVPL